MIDKDWQQQVTTKSGKQILLRYPQFSDAPALTEYINTLIAEDEFLLINQIQSLEEEGQYLESVLSSMKDGNAIKIFAFADGQLVAGVDLRRKPYKSSHVGTLGISIAKEFRDQGLGGLLIQEILQQAKELLRLQLVDLTCFANNPRALHLYQKHGFQEFGRMPKALLYKGAEFVDQVFMYKRI